MSIWTWFGTGISTISNEETRNISEAAIKKAANSEIVKEVVTEVIKLVIKG